MLSFYSLLGYGNDNNFGTFRNSPVCYSIDCQNDRYPDQLYGERVIETHRYLNKLLIQFQVLNSARTREVTKQNRSGGDRTSDIEPTRQDMASIFTW
jgi:hypothetical protein